ncbi:F11 receptor, tandem duplicate 1 [Xenentodon cancila]
MRNNTPPSGTVPKAPPPLLGLECPVANLQWPASNLDDIPDAAGNSLAVKQAPNICIRRHLRAWIILPEVGASVVTCLECSGVSGFSVTIGNPDVRVREMEVRALMMGRGCVLQHDDGSWLRPPARRWVVAASSSTTMIRNAHPGQLKWVLGADLKCSYSADFGSNPRLEWKFKNKKGSQAYVVFDGKLTEPYSSRVSLYSGSNLRFSKVTREDNGEYICEVSSSKSQFSNGIVMLTVLVPPSVPMCSIPQSVTTGGGARLSCFDNDGSPSPTYKWYKDGTLLPIDPSKIAAFKNATYKLNAQAGILEFSSVAKADSGEYYCEAVNNAGPPQRCKAVRMEARDMNTGGIVAGVIVALLLLGLLIFGVWFANKKGYLPKKSEIKSFDFVFVREHHF